MNQKLFEQGVALARAKRNEEARRIFQQLLTADPTIDAGWLWLASLVKNPDEKRYCATQTLSISPDNNLAKQILKELGTGQMSSPLARRIPAHKSSSVSQPTESQPVNTEPSGCRLFFGRVLKYGGLVLMILSGLALTSGESGAIIVEMIGGGMLFFGWLLLRKR